MTNSMPVVPESNPPRAALFLERPATPGGGADPSPLPVMRQGGGGAAANSLDREHWTGANSAPDEAALPVAARLPDPDMRRMPCLPFR